MVTRQKMASRVVVAWRGNLSLDLKKKLKELGDKVRKAPEYVRKLMDSFKKKKPEPVETSPLVWVDPKTLKIDETRAMKQVEQMSTQQIEDVLKQTAKIMGILAQYEAS